MKKIAILLILSTTIVLFAQLDWEENGVTYNDNPYYLWNETASMAEDDFITTWSQQGETDFDVFAGRYNEEGELVWGEPLIISDAYNVQKDSRVISTSDGNYIISWRDYRYYPIIENLHRCEIYLSKIDSSGNQLWESEVHAITINDYRSYNLLADDDGGCYIAYIDIFNQYNICNYLSDGSLNQSMGIITINNNTNYEPLNMANLQKHQDKLILITEDFELLQYYFSIYAFDLEGNQLWQTDSNTYADIPTLKLSGVAGNHLHFIIDNSGNFLNSIDLETGEILNMDTALGDSYQYSHFKITDNCLLAIKREENACSLDFLDYNAQEINSVQLYSGENASGSFDIMVNEDIEILYKRILNDIYQEEYQLYYYRIAFEGNIIENYSEFIGNSGTIENSLLFGNSNKTCIIFQDEDNKNLKLKYTMKDSNTPFNDLVIINRYDYATSSRISTFVNDWGYFVSCDRNNYNLQGFSSEGETIWNNPVELGLSSGLLNPSIYDEANNSFLQLAFTAQEDNMFSLELYGVVPEEVPGFLWDGNPVPIKDNCGEIYNCEIGKRAENDYIVVWSERNRNSHSLFAQRVFNGETMWDQGGLYLTYLEDHSCSLHIIEDYIVVGSDTQFSVFRLTEDGDPVLGWEMPVSIDVEYLPEFSLSCNVTDAGLVLIWQDESLDYTRVIKAQIISPEGAFYFDEDGLIIYEDPDMALNSVCAVIENDHNYIVYYDHQNIIYSEWDEYFNHIGHHAIPSESYSPREMVKVDDNLIMLRANGSIYYCTYFDLLAIDLLGNMSPILRENPTPILDEWWQTVTHEIKTDNNNVYISWIDERGIIEDNYSSGFTGGNMVYSQKVSLVNTDSNSNLISTKKKLSAYPNPFNPATTISWELDKIDEDAKLAIFNVKGQKVYDFKLDINSNQITWNGKNNSGKNCSSGLYLIRLSNGSETINSKVLMMK